MERAGGKLAQSNPRTRVSLRRGLIALIGLAIAVLGILVSLQIGTLLPGGAVAATNSPGPTRTAPAATVAATPTTTSAPPSAAPATPVPTSELVPAPLTGLLVTPEEAERHPIAVMIDDLSPARPQSGFNSASIVWHAPAEGGIPRYMLIFSDTVPLGVGPIRTSREYS